MEIREYQPGDEPAQAAIYNSAAAAFPCFKPASSEDVIRRSHQPGFDPATRRYAVEGGRIVGYATFSPNGRISYPWCLAGSEHARAPLLGAVLEALRTRQAPAAWAAYRADWTEVIGFFERHGFSIEREMINYAGRLERLGDAPVPEGLEIAPLDRADVPQVLALGGNLFRGEAVGDLEQFFWSNPFLDSSAAFVLRRVADRAVLGAGVAVSRSDYADPTKIDAAMPCFRLGTFGTEAERHKRVSGLVSVVWSDPALGEVLLAEARRRLEAAGLTSAGAQASSDQRSLCALYERHLGRQASFPIVSRRLA